MNNKEKIIIVINNLINARDIIFEQIVNLAMSGELSHLQEAFEINDEFSFSLSHFEDLQDSNVKKLVKICRYFEKDIFEMIDFNDISEQDVNL